MPPAAAHQQSQALASAAPEDFGDALTHEAAGSLGIVRSKGWHAPFKSRSAWREDGHGGDTRRAICCATAQEDVNWKLWLPVAVRAVQCSQLTLHLDSASSPARAAAYLSWLNVLA